MTEFPVNPIDIGVAIILLTSGLLAFSRGVVRETLGVGSWIGAAIATVYVFYYIRPIAREIIDSQLIADAAAGAAIFIVSLIIFTIVTQLIAGRIQKSRLGALDRMLGIIFGVFRGALLVSLAQMMFVWAVGEDDKPAWVDQAITMPYIIHGANTIRSIVPHDTLHEAQKRVKATGEGIRKVQEADENRRAAEEDFKNATDNSIQNENTTSEDEN